MTEHEKQQRHSEHYASLPAQYISEEWSYQWRHPKRSLSYQTAHEHMLTAENKIKNPELLAHL